MPHRDGCRGRRSRWAPGGGTECREATLRDEERGGAKATAASTGGARDQDDAAPSGRPSRARGREEYGDWLRGPARGRRSQRTPVARPIPRQPTAAAPMSGPSAEPGRDDAGRAGEVEAGPQAQLRLGGGEERRAVAEGDRAGHAGQPQVEQVGDRRHRPADQPAGPLDDLAAPASAGSPPVSARMAVPDASASRQPRPPHAHGRPSGSTMTWPMWPALPRGAVEQPAVEHDAAADAGRHDHRDEVALARPRRRSSPRRAPAPWRRCRRTSAARCASARRARSGKARHAGMLSGDTVTAARRPSARRTRPRTRPAAPAGRLDHRSTSPASAANSASASSPRRSAASDAGQRPRPRSSTTPAASFVPPMSTASARSTAIGRPYGGAATSDARRATGPSPTLSAPHDHDGGSTAR